MKSQWIWFHFPRFTTLCPAWHLYIALQMSIFLLADLIKCSLMLSQKTTNSFKADPKHSLYLACALMLRGNVEISDIRRNIERLKPSLHFIHWNQEGWKTGLCSIPPVGQPYSLLALANNTCIRHTFQDLKDRFMKLYKRKAHVHHYTHVDGMEVSQFDSSIESLSSLISEYDALEAHMGRVVDDIQRLTIAWVYNTSISGRSRGGAWGASPPPYFRWKKTWLKEE